MSPPAQGTRLSGPPWPGPKLWLPTSRPRTSRPAAARPKAQGVELEWVEADAEALPFADGEFDVVTSSFGAIFAPHHQAVADEMLRVCRPGGTIGMLNFTPEGLISDFFGALAPYMPPPPPGAQPPPLWGSEEHVRELFGDRLGSLEMTRSEYVERAESPRDYRELFKQTFGPVVATYASLADDPDRAAALDRDFLDFATRSNRGAPGVRRSTRTSTCSCSHGRATGSSAADSSTDGRVRAASWLCRRRRRIEYHVRMTRS